MINATAPRLVFYYKFLIEIIENVRSKLNTGGVPSIIADDHNKDSSFDECLNHNGLII